MLTVRSVNAHRAMDWRPFEGHRALPVRTESVYTLQGAGEQSGQTLSFDGAGRRHSVDFLSAGGNYLGSVAVDTSTFEVLLTQIGMVIPGRQWSADTVRTVP